MIFKMWLTVNILRFERKIYRNIEIHCTFLELFYKSEIFSKYKGKKMMVLGNDMLCIK